MFENNSVPVLSKPRDFIVTNDFFFNFAHEFLTLKRKFLQYSFTAEIQLPVLRPISGLDFIIYLKISVVINFREQ